MVYERIFFYSALLPDRDQVYCVHSERLKLTTS